MTTRRQFIVRKERRMYYKTIEYYDPVNGVLRYVDGRRNPKNFTLEADAPRNAGESVEYIGGAVSYSLPQQNEDNPSLEIQLGRIGQFVKSKLKAITGFGRFQPAEVIIREYIEGEETSPAAVVRFYVSTITMTADGVVMLAALDNPASRRICRIVNEDDFPGLAEQL